jgi:hypothetical protein
MPVTVEYANLTGGMNQFTPASALGDSELSMGMNLKPRLGARPRVRVRGGLRRLFTFVGPSGANETVLGLKSALRNGVKGLVVLGIKNSSFYFGDFANPVELGEIGPSLSSDPWSVAAWNESIFAARREDGLRLINLGPDSLGDAGVAAPTGALTASDGGAGVLTAGDYYWTYAFYDSRLGTMSSKSPVSNTLTLAADKQGSLTGFDAAPETRFDQYAIFRSFPDGTGAEYFTEFIDVADVPHLDNIPIIQQGQQASSDNDPPESDVHTVVYWQGRLWVLNYTYLYPSKIGNPEAFPASDAIKVGQDSTEYNIDMVATQNRLVIGKRRSLWTVTGTGAGSWNVRPLDLLHGVAAPRSMVEHGGYIIWQSDDDYYISDGVSAGQPLSGPGLRKLDPFFKQRTPSEPNVSASVPGSDGVILGLRSRVITDEEVPE